MRPKHVALIVVATSLLALIGWAAFFAIRAYRSSPGYREKIRFTELVRLAGHDESQAERLVIYEQMRNPARSKIELIDSAIDRLIRDRR